MSGIEIIGLAAAVLQIAEAGGKLSVRLFTFTRKVKNANKSIDALTQDIAATGAVLKQLGETLSKDDNLRVCSREAVYTARALVEETKKVFVGLEKLIDGDEKPNAAKQRIINWKQKLKFPFLEPQILQVQANLERLKSSLLVILNLLVFAEQLRNKETLPVLKEQRELIRILASEKDENEKRYERILKAIEDKSATADHTTSTNSSIMLNASVNSSKTNFSTASTIVHPTSENDTASTLESHIDLSALSKSLDDTVKHPSSPNTSKPVLGSSDRSFPNINLPPGLKHHHSRIQHHTELVQNLLSEIKNLRYDIDHGTRDRMHTGVLEIHWSEWEGERRRHGHEHFEKIFVDHGDVIRYWSDKQYLEKERDDSTSQAAIPSKKFLGRSDIVSPPSTIIGVSKGRVHVNTPSTGQHSMTFESPQDYDKSYVNQMVHYGDHSPSSGSNASLQPNQVFSSQPQPWLYSPVPAYHVPLVQSFAPHSHAQATQARQHQRIPPRSLVSSPPATSNPSSLAQNLSSNRTDKPGPRYGWHPQGSAVPSVPPKLKPNDTENKPPSIERTGYQDLIQHLNTAMGAPNTLPLGSLSPDEHSTFPEIVSTGDHHINYGAFSNDEDAEAAAGLAAMQAADEQEAAEEEARRRTEQLQARTLSNRYSGSNSNDTEVENHEGGLFGEGYAGQMYGNYSTPTMATGRTGSNGRSISEARSSALQGSAGLVNTPLLPRCREIKADQEASKAKQTANDTKQQELEERKMRTIRDLEESTGVACRKTIFESDSPIHFIDVSGRSFDFPFYMCKKWVHMKRLVLQIYKNDESKGPSVRKGFFLTNDSGKHMSSVEWERLIQPGMVVRMRLRPVQVGHRVLLEQGARSPLDTGKLQEGDTQWRADQETDMEEDRASEVGQPAGSLIPTISAQGSLEETGVEADNGVETNKNADADVGHARRLSDDESENGDAYDPDIGIDLFFTPAKQKTNNVSVKDEIANTKVSQLDDIDKLILRFTTIQENELRQIDLEA